MVDTLENFRRANPELRDWSDAELASALYKKYGQGMDEFDFALELKGKGKRATPFEVGTAGVKSAFQTALAAAEERLGFEEAAKENIKAAQERQQDVGERYKRKVESYEDIVGPSSAAQYAYERGMESLPAMAVPVAGGISGAILGSAVPGIGTVAGGIGGAMLADVPMMLGQNIQEQMGRGKSLAETDLRTAFPAAVMQAGLDVAINRFVPGLGKLGEIGASKLLTRTAVRGLEGMAQESGTEALQEALQIAQADPQAIYDFDKPTQARLVEAAVAGGLLGGALGGVHGIAGGRGKVAPGKTTEVPSATPVAEQPGAVTPEVPGISEEPPGPLGGKPTAPGTGPTYVIPEDLPKNQWVEDNYPQLAALDKEQIATEIVPSTGTEPAPVAANTRRLYFSKDIIDSSTNSPLLFLSPQQLFKAGAKADVAYADIGESDSVLTGLVVPANNKNAFAASPTTFAEIEKSAQPMDYRPPVTEAVQFENLPDKAIHAVSQPDAEKTNPNYKLYKDFLTQGLGMSEEDIQNVAPQVADKVDETVKQARSDFESGARKLDEPIVVPRTTGIASQATFPAEMPQTIGGIDPNSKDPTDQKIVQDILTNTVTSVDKRTESLLPGMTDILRDIQVRMFPGTKISYKATNLRPGVAGQSSRSDSPGKELTFDVAFDPKQIKHPAEMMRTIFHELAHVIEYTWINNLDKATLKAVIDQYVKETDPTLDVRLALDRVIPSVAKGQTGLTQAEIGDILNKSFSLTGTKVKRKGGAASQVKSDQDYYYKFAEWVAEKGASWFAERNRIPANKFDQFRKNIFDKLQYIYGAISRFLGLKPNQGAFERLLSDIYGKARTTPGYRESTTRTVRAQSAAAAQAAGIPISGISPNKIAPQGTTITEEYRPGYSLTGDRIITEEHPLTLQDIEEHQANPALLKDNVPLPMQSYGLTATARQPKGFWAELMASFVGQEKGESLLQAFARNNFAAHIPFLQRAELRHVGQTMERLQNAQGRISGLIDSGHIAINTKGEVVFSSKIGDKEVGGLKKLFEKIGVQHEQAFQEYAIARREQDLRRAGRSGLGYKHPNTGKPFTDKELQDIINAAPQFIKDVAEDYFKFNQKMVDFAIDTGVIPADLGKTLGLLFYTPFYRAQEADIANNGTLTIGGEVGGVLKNPTTISLFNQRLTDGGTIEAGFYENTFRNYASIITAGLKNMAYRNAGEALIQVGDTSLAQKVGKPGKNTITYRVEGNEHHLQINDVPMFQSFAAFSPKQQNKYVQAASQVANWMRTGTTIAPGFQIANLIRGAIDVKIKTGMPVMQLVAGTFRGIREAYNRGASLQAIQAATGFGGFRYGSNPEAQANALKATYAIKEGTATLWQRATDLLGKLETLADASEMGPRIAYYNYLLKQGVDSETAAWESVNLQNFSRSGAGGGISGSLLAHLIPMVPFLNAKMQGLFRLFEHGTIGAPESFISKGAMGIPKAIVYRGMMLAFIELGLNAIYGDDEWYKKLSTNDKIQNNYIKVNETVLAIPRGYEYGSFFGAIPALVMDAIRQQEGKQLTDGLWQIFSTTFFFNPIPQVVKPLTEIYFNKDTYNWRDIETLSEINYLPAAERYDENTSEIAKLIGAYIPIPGLSPKKADVLIRGYGGTMATTLASVFDGFIASSGVRPMGYFGDPSSPQGILFNAVGLSRFVKAPELMTSRYLKDFYDMKQDVTQIMGSIARSQDSADLDAIKEKLEKDPAADTLKKQLDKVSSKINDLNRQMNVIRLNPSILPDDKIKRIQMLRDLKNKLAEDAVNFGKQVGY